MEEKKELEISQRVASVETRVGFGCWESYRKCVQSKEKQPSSNELSNNVHGTWPSMSPSFCTKRQRNFMPGASQFEANLGPWSLLNTGPSWAAQRSPKIYAAGSPVFLCILTPLRLSAGQRSLVAPERSKL